MKGYFPIGTVWSSISPLGVSRSAFEREVEYLAKAHCILSEDFRTEELTDSDLVKLGPAGLVHVHLLSDVSYLAAVGEDTWFSSEAVARTIAARIRDPADHYEASTALYNAKDVVAVLDVARQAGIEAAGSFVAGSEFAEMTDLSAATTAITALERSLVQPAWATASSRFAVGTTHEGRIASLLPFGVLIELDVGVTGLAHSSSFPSGYHQPSTPLRRGNIVVVTVLDIRPVEAKMSLKLERVIASSH